MTSRRQQAVANYLASALQWIQQRSVSKDKLVVATADSESTEDSTENADEESGELTEEEIFSSVSDSDFDESLLDAEPIYQFDYKGRHIATYLTYSLIFDGDNVTVRNMQLFVKNGQLFALNAPDDIVPGEVVIDSYQGSNYMTVLTKTGRMVDLMEALSYPEDFVNRNIKHISSNLYSDLTYVQVEYEDGTILAFNYLTGSVIYEEEAEEETTVKGGSLSDFLNYILGFFQEKFDTAYAEVTNAYASALELKDYLNANAWSSLLTSEALLEDDEIGMDGEVYSDFPAAIAEEDLDDVEPSVDANRTDDADLVQDADRADNTDPTGVADRAHNTDSQGAGSGYESESEDVTADGAAADDSDSAAAAGEAGSAGAADDADSADEEAEDAESQESTSDELSDDLIIAYDGENGKYALFAEDELLGSEESVISVDLQMEDYLANGGTLDTYEDQFASLTVSGTQKKGIYILVVTGSAIGTMLLVLIVQKTKKRSRQRKS
jgi:hypothetical protein